MAPGRDVDLIALIKGKLAMKDPGGTIIVDTGAVGYRLFVSLNTLVDLPEVGEELSLYAVTVVREDAFKLFGFSQTEEKDLFNPRWLALFTLSFTSSALKTGSCGPKQWLLA